MTEKTWFDGFIMMNILAVGVAIGVELNQTSGDESGTVAFTNFVDELTFWVSNGFRLSPSFVIGCDLFLRQNKSMVIYACLPDGTTITSCVFLCLVFFVSSLVQLSLNHSQVFLWEAILRIWACGSRPWVYFRDINDGSFNTFDFILVVVSVVFSPYLGLVNGDVSSIKVWTSPFLAFLWVFLQCYFFRPFLVPFTIPFTLL